MPKRYSTFDVKKDAWAYDSLTNAYYLHIFSKKQPDLNWNNPRLRTEMHNIIKFWLDKGIHGFRMDALQFVAKDPSFPPTPGLTEQNHANAYNHGPLPAGSPTAGPGLTITRLTRRPCLERA